MKKMLNELVRYGKFAFALAFALCCFNASATAITPADYFAKKVDFTIGGYLGSSTLANFPVLVKLSTAGVSGLDYSACGTDGANIRFIDADNNLLPFEIDTWNPSGESFIWVSVPSLSGTSTKITMCYGANGSDCPSADGTVWTLANYKSVWHMDIVDGASNTKVTSDRVNGYSGTVVNPNECCGAGEGLIGGDYYCHANHSAASGTEIHGIKVLNASEGFNSELCTYSAWVRQIGGNAVNGKPDGANYPRISWATYGNCGVIWNTGNSKYSGSLPGLEFNLEGQSDNSQMGVRDKSANIKANLNSGLTLHDKEWHYMVVRYDNDGGTGHRTVWMDGVQQTGFNQNTTHGVPQSSWTMFMGTRFDSSEPDCVWTGDLDEMRFRAEASSEDWLAAEYANVTSASFLSNDGAKNIGDEPLAREWTVREMGKTGAEIRADGTFKYGYCRHTATGSTSSRTVNGVTFVAYPDETDFNNNQNAVFSPGMAHWYAGFGAAGVEGAWGDTLNNGFYNDSGYENTTLTLNGLTAGKQYVVQIITHNNSEDDTITVGGVTAHALKEYGSSLECEFTATAASESFAFTCAGGKLVVNAIQVRELGAAPPSAEWDTDCGTFAKRIAFTASGYEGSETLANFPVLVRLTESIKDFDYDDCDQSKIVFTDASGAILPHEVDTWNTSGESLVWVNVASLSQDATFYMYFDGEPTEVNDATKTWTDSDYAGVWHMNEASGAVADATGHGLTATPAGNNASTESVAVSGAPTGTGRQTSTSTDKFGAYLAVAADNDLNVGNDFTMSGWVKMTAIAANGYPRLFCTKDNGTDSGWEFEMYRGNYDQLTIRGTGSATTYTKQISTLKDTWRHVVAVFDGTTATLYVDGEVVSDDIGVSNLGIGSNGLGIGNKPAGGASNNFAGDFDECRLLDAVASADWVKAEYQQSAKPTFLSAGTVETHVASTYTVSWTGGENATVVATVDSTPINTGDSVEDGKSVVFTVTPNSGYEFATASDGWTKSGANLTKTVTVNGAAVAVTVPNATQLQVSEPAIGSVTAEVSFANATISLSGIALGTDDSGIPATQCELTYELSGAASKHGTGRAMAALAGTTSSFTISDLENGEYTCTVTLTTDKEKTATGSTTFTIAVSQEPDEPVLEPGWTASPMSSNGDTIRTEGALLYAYMRGSDKDAVYTINTVPFTGVGNANLREVYSNQSYNLKFEYGQKLRDWNQNISATLSPYEQMLAGNWRSGATDNRLVLKDLVAGNRYLVQIVIKSTEHGDEDYNSDHSNQDDCKTSSPEGNVTARAAGDGWEYGGSLVGVFDANDSTKTFELPCESKSLLNAIQVRDVSPTETIEPKDTPALTRQAIQAAIDRAAPTHREVKLSSGLFEIDVSLKVTNGVSLVGQGWEKTILKQTGADRCAIVSGNSKIEGMVITGGGSAAAWNCGLGVEVQSGTLAWCYITNNVNKSGNNLHGGGVRIQSGVIDHCIVASNKVNEANCYGGGISCRDATGEILINCCLVYGNSTGASGGGISIDNRSVNTTIRNTTVAGNISIANLAGSAATAEGAGLYVGSNLKNVNVYNSIFYGNTVEGAAYDLSAPGGLATDSNNIVGVDPSFVDAANGNYHLGDLSVAIGAGMAYADIGVDLDNNQFDVMPSVGCYEYVSVIPVPKFTPASGMKFQTDLAVSISGQGTIYYTTDGSVPTTSSPVYSSPITIDSKTRFKARSCVGGAWSAVAMAVYGKIDDGDYYVSIEGSDSADGLTPESAFRTIAHAVEVAKDGQKVTVFAGTFEIDETLVIDKAITVTGYGWDEDGTIIKPASGKNIQVVALDGGAKLEHVKVTGGNSSKGCGGVQITNGTLSWSRVEGNASSANESCGVSFLYGKGQVDHCIVANNTNSSKVYGAGIGAYSYSGVDTTSGPVLIDTCLVVGNKAGGSSTAAGIGFKDAKFDLTVRNCTIVNNSGATVHASGLLFENCDGKTEVINTIVYGNTGHETQYSANRTVSLQNNLLDGTDPKFVDYANGNYHLASDSPAYGTGVSYDGIGETLDGVPFNNPPSIGCYESQAGFGKVKFGYPAKHTGTATVQLVGLSEGVSTADVKFQYGTEPENLCTPIVITNGVGIKADIVAWMTDMEPNTTYYYRYEATENDGSGDPKTYVREGTFRTTDWDVLQFSTVKVAARSTSAEASVTIMKLGAGATKADIYVQWGTDANNLCDPIRIATTAVEKDTYSYPISGLSPDTDYLVRFTGENDDGDTAMRELYFKTTEAEQMVLKDARVSIIDTESAMISVSVPTIGDGASTATVTLRYVIDGQSDTNSVTMTTSAYRGMSLSQQISGLTPNTRYYYEIEAVNDAATPDDDKVSGKFWSDDPTITASDRSTGYPTPEGGKVVTYDADNAGNEDTLEPGSPYVVVGSTGYGTNYTSTVTDPGQDYYFRDEYDLQYNASARIGDKYYLFVSDAVDAAKSGDEIQVLRNNYAVEKTMKITTDLTINGNGHVIKVATPFLDKAGYVVDNPSPVYVVFLCANGSDVKLNNMTVMGGGAHVDGYDAFISAICVGNEAGPNVSRNLGGSNGVLEMDHVTITRSQGGLNIAADTKCRMNACNIVRNARACGGGFYNRGLVVMENSSLSENRSLRSDGGGAACENQGALFMNNCVILNNGSTEYGGAINMVGNTGTDKIPGSPMHAYCYMMNMTMAGNFSCHANNVGGGIGFHQTIEDTYMLNCILCNNYWYDTSTGKYQDSDIRIDTGSAYFLYSVYGNIVSGSYKSTEFKSVNAAAEKVFKSYSPFKRVYQKVNLTSCEIPGPGLGWAPDDELARYAPLTENDSEAYWDNAGVYTYFDASDWRSWVNDGKAPKGIKMSYKTFGGEMTALGKCEAADEEHLVTTYYESAFDPTISDREIGVVGASGFGTKNQTYTLYLTKEPVNGSVSDNLTTQGKSYDAGTEVTVVATPAAKCTFEGWYNDQDELVSSKTVYTLVMDSDKKLYAKFSAPSVTHRFFKIKCEQEEGTHDLFPLEVTKDWLLKCWGSVPVEDAQFDPIEAWLNEPDEVNGLNHKWMNYVLGGLEPGDPSGRIWIRGEQTVDEGTLNFKMQELAETVDCGFQVRYRLAKMNVHNGETSYTRGHNYQQQTSGTFNKESVSSDELQYRIIDMIFIPTNANTRTGKTLDTSYEYVTTVNTAGVLKVSSDKKVEILSSPWVGFSPTNNPPILAPLYAKASCLSEGDTLYVYDRANSNYLAWVSDKSGNWTVSDTYLIKNGVVQYQHEADASRTNSLDRGLGAWLERKDPKSPIYLFGQVDPTPVETTLEAGFNLVGNPYPYEYDVSQLPPGTNSLGEVRIGIDGDHIVIPTGADPINCYYDAATETWGRNGFVYKQRTDRQGNLAFDRDGNPIYQYVAGWTTDGLTLPIGHGFWYYNDTTNSSTKIELAWPTK